MTDGMPDPFAPLSPAESSGRLPGTTPTDDFVSVLPAPEPLPNPIRHRRLGAPSQVWRYTDATGRLLFAVCRFDKPDGKQVLPFTFGVMKGKRGWHWHAPAAPRPLYALDRLALRADAPVLVVEGEKAAEAAATLFSNYAVTTSPSGAKAARQTDWSLLRGRDVVIWPDQDAAGRAYAADVAELARAAGARGVRMVVVPDQWPDGWDLADALPAGVDAPSLRSLLAAATDVSGFALAPAAMPSGFYEKASGIFLRADDPEKPDTHVCGPLHVLAATHDGSGEDWGALLRWRDDDGRLHEWAMPRGLLAGDGTEVRATLLRGGLFVGTGHKAREGLETYLMRAVRAAARVRIVPRIGWHETPAGNLFALPKETIAPPGVEPVRLQTERPEALPPVATSGTLAQWQSNVAELAAGNSRLVLGLSMAFAAPLLGVIGAEGGGVHLRGMSSSGKSTALIVAGSVWGGGGLRGWSQRWRATDNGLEAVAAAHCDLLLTLDELGEMDPRHLGAAAYMLAGGAGKLRAGRDGGGRRVAEWRLMFLSSGEISIADRLAEAGPGRRATAGQEVRVIDLSADGGAGLGLFERLHGEADGSAFAERLKTAASHYYGAAGISFLRALVEDLAGAKEAVRQYRSTFVAKNVPSDADGQVSRVGDRFALIAAGGELATKFGILPWQPGEASRAAKRCFDDWRQNRGGDGPAEITAGIREVRRFLEVHAEGRFRLLSDGTGGTADPVGAETASATVGNERVLLAGFRRNTPDGTEFFILPETWRAEVTRGFDAGTLAGEMVRRKFLRPDPGDNKPSCRCSLPGRSKGARAYIVLPALLAADG